MTFHRKLTLAVAVAAVAIAGHAAAGEVRAKSDVKDVTVFPDGAEVVRTVEADIPAGDSTLVVGGLPRSMDPTSLRLTGEAAEALGIGPVESRATPAGGRTATEDAIAERLKELQSKWAAAKGDIATSNAEIELVTKLASSSEAPGRMPLKDWKSTLEVARGALREEYDKLHAGEAVLARIDEEIKSLSHARPQPPLAGATTNEVTVSLSAAAATRVKLRLSYRVAGAGWRPVYDARLDTKRGALEWTRRAQVSQNTGEDWTAVTLSASTVRTRAATDAPEMSSLLVGLAPPPQPAGAERAVDFGYGFKPQSAARLANGAVKSMAGAVASPSAESGAALAPGVEPGAAVEAGDYSATFVLPGRISVASDGSSHTFRIGSRVAPQKIEEKTKPSVSETAYIVAHVANDDEAAMLSGVVYLYRDGAFVGTGRIPLVAAGDSFDLGFGADDSVKVKRVPLAAKETEGNWIDKTRTQTSDFKTTIKNLHAIPVHVVVVDRVPVAENGEVKVETLDQTTAAPAPDADSPRGLKTWSYDLAPNETREVRLAYRISWPRDRTVVFGR